MKCPSCGAGVEEGADLCLECGEPMGDSPAARVARGEEAPTLPVPKVDVPPAPLVAAVPKRSKRRVEAEPEPLRCPGCGMLSGRQRCPNCGTVLRRSDD